MKLYAQTIDLCTRRFTREFLGHVKDQTEAIELWRSLKNIGAWEWSHLLKEDDAAEPAMAGDLPWDSWKLNACREDPLEKKTAAAQQAADRAVSRAKREAREAKNAKAEKAVATVETTVLSDGTPTPAFWRLWKDSKNALIEAGWYVGKEGGQWKVKRGTHDGKKWKAPAFGTEEEQAERKKVIRERNELERGAFDAERASMDYRADRNDGLMFPSNEALNNLMLEQQERAEP